MTHCQLIQIYLVLVWNQSVTFLILCFKVGLSQVSFIILKIFAFSILNQKRNIIVCHYLYFLLLLLNFLLALYLFSLRYYCVIKVHDFLIGKSLVFSCINFIGCELIFVIIVRDIGLYFSWFMFEEMFFLTNSFIFL